MAPCSVWARIRVTAVPANPGRKPEEIEVGVKVCSVPDPEDAIGSWSVELHTESSIPEAVHKEPGPGGTNAVPKETFYAEVIFHSALVLTHIKGRCETLKGERFMKAVKLPEALVFMPGDHAHIEINVYRDADAARIPPPSVEVFQEPEPNQELGRAAARPSFALGSSRSGPRDGIPTRPIGLFY
jgi:hypothetical protein